METTHSYSYGTTFNDLHRPLSTMDCKVTIFSTLNIPETTRDGVIVTIEHQ